MGERCDALRATIREDAMRLPRTTDVATITVRLSWAVLAVCLVSWPITSLTVFRGEPQGVLGLSWVALILSAANTILTAIVNRKADVTSDDSGDTEVTDG
jgi:hypothetical protein